MTKDQMYSLIEAHYRQHFSFLTKALRRSAGSSQNAEDAVQEAYTNALQYWKTYDEDLGPFSAWFSPILQNAIKKTRRADVTHGMTGMGSDGALAYEDFRSVMANTGADGSAFDSAWISEIERFIDEERPDVATVLRLALIHQLPYGAIAKLVPQNPNNIQSLVYKFRKRLEIVYS